uniref:Uncharacterized protein n=1 Tax=Knipowitschia caucasica TaxID=637954 RepID=A0AAV2L330_KNICA
MIERCQPPFDGDITLPDAITSVHLGALRPLIYAVVSKLSASKVSFPTRAGPQFFDTGPESAETWDGLEDLKGTKGLSPVPAPLCGRGDGSVGVFSWLKPGAAPVRRLWRDAFRRGRDHSGTPHDQGSTPGQG